MASGNALGDDRALGVFAHMNHLGSGIGLLVIIRQRHGVKLADGIVTLQNAAWILPCNR